MTIALAAAAGLASTGSAYVGARNLLSGQADRARRVIPKSWDIPPRADGVYSSGGGPVERWHRGMPFDLHLMIFGDSTAAGYGCEAADELPGVLIARGLAKNPADRPRSTRAFLSELEARAGAAYGPFWEDQGRRELAERTAAVLPLLAGGGGGSATATRQAAANPATPGTSNVPERTSRSWPPPWVSGVHGTPRLSSNAPVP